MPLTLSLTYYKWITQAISGSDLATAVLRFSDLLEAELASALRLSVTIKLAAAMDVSEQIADIRLPRDANVAGKIALMNPLGYAMAHRDSSEVEAVAVVRRKIGSEPAGPHYRSQIYCHVDTEITRLSELKGRSFGFGSPQSTSNFLVPASNLLQAGLHPLYSFSRLEFAGGHDKVAQAVYERHLDAGAGHDGVIADLSAKPGYKNAQNRLVRLAWSEPIMSDPVAVHIPDVPTKTAVQTALLAVAKADDQASAGNAAVCGFWGTKEGFEKATPDQYAYLLGYLAPLGLKGDDLIMKW